MANISETVKSGYQTESMLGPNCTICGNPPADAMWSCEQGVFVCFQCAVEKLPLLIADSVRFGNNELENTRHAEDVLTAVTASFWRGVANRIARRANEGTP